MAKEASAVIYARVSTARQADEELPIESQIQHCTKKASGLGARVDRVFMDEGISGTHDKRPAFQDAIHHCETIGADYLITWSTSRFARNKIDAGLYKLRLKKAGTEIIYASLDIDRNTASVSLPRERFWDIPVPKIDSQTRQPISALAALRPCRFATPSQARRWLRSTPTNGLTACLMPTLHPLWR